MDLDFSDCFRRWWLGGLGGGGDLIVEFYNTFFKDSSDNSGDETNIIL